ncbi:N-acetyltransferase [Brevibacillus fluminis]|uniref:N-acetyltransferase n=1 Tax=Brevibacillus fluminis TaxID=511487 RepID=A0A3M8DTG1_9BACL|nr:GNAT family N-acetyltransferase [Brevibacillus fluminis]RNB91372.1 N-acetyltransferase [Brevibacillus fluminis]
MALLETERLRLRRISLDDAAFILELLNDPAWIRFIGDKGVRTLEDARNYILNVPMKMYEQTGFGLYLVELGETGSPIGMCGLIKRDSLPDVDIGFAFLPAYRSKGYAYESAAAVLADGKETFGLQRIVAITSIDNHDSAALLQKLGMQDEGRIRLADDQEELRLFGIAL